MADVYVGNLVWKRDETSGFISERNTTDEVAIGLDTPTAKTHIKGETTDDTKHSLKIDDSADGNLLSVRNDGLISTKNYTLPIADGTDGQILTTDGSGAVTFESPAIATSIADADGDTKIQVEESADEDHIRFDTAGSQRAVIDETGKVGIGTDTPYTALEVNGGVKIGNETGTCDATLAGTNRYYVSGNNSYVDVCMQTGAATFEWKNVQQMNW